MIRKEIPKSPSGLVLVTPDLYGKRLDNGLTLPTHQTGLVRHSQQIIDGIHARIPGMNIVATRNIFSGYPETYNISTPGGATLLVEEIQVGFEQYFNSSTTHELDPALFRYYYEEDVKNPHNPIYLSLAKQHSAVISRAPSSVVFLQNPIPLVSLLRIEELGLIDPLAAKEINAVAVIHDIEGYQGRLSYASERLSQTNMNINCIAISRSVERDLRGIGFAREQLFYVPNGIDIDKFNANFDSVKEENIFDNIRERNQLPPEGKMVLISSRMVSHKGHSDAIEALNIMQNNKMFSDVYMAFTGKDMTSFQSSSYQNQLLKLINKYNLGNRVYLLDALSDSEVYSCYANAFAALLPSTQPEGFGFSNLEAMLAGVPVITSNIGGPLNYIRDRETGILIRPGHPADIASAIKLLISDRSLYEDLSKNGREKAKEYGVDHMISSYIKIGAF